MLDRRRDPIAAFNRRLDTHLTSDTGASRPQDERLSAEDREALDLALRLAALNPSLGSRARYPLRRKLLAQAERQNRPVYRRADALLRQPRAWLQPAASFSMTLALIFVFSWVIAGLNFSTGSGHPVTPAAGHLPEMLSLTSEPFPPAGSPIRAGLSPQPIPTPAAPSDRSTGTRTIQNTGQPYQTPVLTGQQALPVSASSVTP